MVFDYRNPPGNHTALTGIFPSPSKPPSIPELKLHERLQSAKAAFRHPSKIILNEKSQKNKAHRSAEILRLLAGLFPSLSKPPSIPALRFQIAIPIG